MRSLLYCTPGGAPASVWSDAYQTPPTCLFLISYTLKEFSPLKLVMVVERSYGQMY